MDEATRARILAGLVEAIQSELQGHHFYKMAASNTDDDQGRSVFERLAGEELDHANYLRAQHGAIAARGTTDDTVALGPRMDLGAPSPIFSARLTERVQDAHYEMTALSIGMQLEESAVQFYRAQAGSVDVPKIREFYERLAEWESGHFSALHRQYEVLKEDYWGQQGFAPF